MVNYMSWHTHTNDFFNRFIYTYPFLLGMDEHFRTINFYSAEIIKTRHNKKRPTQVLVMHYQQAYIFIS